MDEQTVNPWIAALSGGLNAYIDSQNPQGYAMTGGGDPYTQYGQAGQAQRASASITASNPLLLLGIGLVVVVLLLRK
jgi:hypothetical protein